MSDNFTWEFGDRVVEFKRFADLPLKAFREIHEKGLDDMGALFVLIKVACSQEDVKFLDEQNLGSFDGLVTAWAAASVVTLPES